jgi:hypothetical protein
MASEKQQIPPHYAKGVMHGFLGPASWANIMYFLIDDSSATPAQCQQAVADAMGAFYSDVFGLANLPTVWSTTFCSVTYIDPGGSVRRARLGDADLGTSSAGYQDAQVSYLINWATTDPRRGGKARQYVPGVLDAKMADSAFLLSAWQSTLNTGIGTWFTALAGHSPALQLVEMSFRDAKTWRDTPFAYVVDNGTVNPVVATQRRRVDRLRPS